MNTAELCPEGREKYAQWMMWINYRNLTHGGSRLVYTDRAEKEAHRNYKEHLQKCKICGRGE